MANARAKPLVIVESPAKARTLTRFLGDAYRVEASYGHIRDLPENASEVPAEIQDRPWSRMGVDIEGDFTPYYVVSSDKKPYVRALKTALKDAPELLLATDPDREGESISWHLVQVLRPKVPVRRVVFHEITEDAVRHAIENAQTIDEDLVRAQESRRILDRLYGYTLSPVLWKKVKTGLSAGRVQSVAVRLLVEREEARRAFRSSVYWDLSAQLSGEAITFTAALTRVGAERVATGRDFDPVTGALRTPNVRHLDEAVARQLTEALTGWLPWTVTTVDQKPGTERPAPPFTTSTLTQEASRKLGFSTGRTMQIAQRLFQGMDIGGGEMEGLITYHRTDSTTLSDKALSEAARVITDLFGAEYYTGARRYQTKVRNAQEAHEAIRPTDFRLAPQRLSSQLDQDELRLYELIWKRTMASQMADARVRKTLLEITAAGPDGEPCVLSASGKAIEFAGFRRAYVEGSDDPASELEDQESLLPSCRVGDQVAASGAPLTFHAIEPKKHETTPPARFTEASLIRELEEAGIGRPSTYAPTIETILKRGYVFRQRKALVPSFMGFAVTTLLREHFGDYVDVGFTARLEDDLDQISNGRLDRLAFLKEFYRGDDGEGAGLETRVSEGQSSIDYPVIDLGADPDTGLPVRVRIGRYGPYLQRGDGGTGHTASLPEDLAPADLTIEQASALLRARAEGPRALGVDPKSGETVFVIRGRFGPYVQLGETPERGARAPKPRRASLPDGRTEDTVTLDEALRLLDLPRLVGAHPDDGEPIETNFGRFGPYVRHGSEFRSLESDEDVFTVSLERALQILAEPKRSRRRQAQKTVLRELGAHPESGAAIQLLQGRYGPYVTDGTTNASLARGADPGTIDLEQAVTMIAERAAAGPAKRKGRSTKRTAPAGASRTASKPRAKRAAAARTPSGAKKKTATPKRKRAAGSS